MLRAVWLGDKAAFDACYRWSETHLRRKEDSLLAWHWKDGKITDSMPAADADIDYALSLLQAEARWPGQAPEGLAPYGARGLQSAEDILRLLTFRAGSRLHLSPWILRPKAEAPFPVNPSYYSPAHFRVFHRASGDARWRELAETSYHILGELSKGFQGRRGVGLFPDWCSVDAAGKLGKYRKKNTGSGWEAVRIPFRVGLDHAWFRRPEAAAVLGPLAAFAAGEWSRTGKIFCEYGYDGKPVKEYENPAFYAAYYWALSVSDFPVAGKILAKTRKFPDAADSRLYGPDYFPNSLAWLGEGLASGLIQKAAP